jgi:hypothetical protein
VTFSTLKSRSSYPVKFAWLMKSVSGMTFS